MLLKADSLNQDTKPLWDCNKVRNVFEARRGEARSPGYKTIQSEAILFPSYYVTLDFASVINLEQDSKWYRAKFQHSCLLFRKSWHSPDNFLSWSFCIYLNWYLICQSSLSRPGLVNQVWASDASVVWSEKHTMLPDWAQNISALNWSDPLVYPV